MIIEGVPIVFRSYAIQYSK